MKLPSLITFFSLLFSSSLLLQAATTINFTGTVATAPTQWETCIIVTTSDLSNLTAALEEAQIHFNSDFGTQPNTADINTSELNDFTETLAGEGSQDTNEQLHPAGYALGVGSRDVTLSF